jgi:hypothetical protein
MGYGLDDWGSTLVWGKNLAFLHSVQTGSETHTNSYLVGTEGFFSGGKAVNIPYRAEVRNGYAAPPFRHMSSCRGP